MDTLKQVCREMAANQHVMTFTDIAQAAVNGAALGQKANNPVIGAVLGVSLEASKRAVLISQELINQQIVMEAAKQQAAKQQTAKKQPEPKNIRPKPSA